MSSLRLAIPVAAEGTFRQANAGPCLSAFAAEASHNDAALHLTDVLVKVNKPMSTLARAARATVSFGTRTRTRAAIRHSLRGS